MNCETCNHEAHAAGHCKKDNCGSSEICHSDAIWSDWSHATYYFLSWDVDPKTKKRRQRLSFGSRAVTHIRPRDTGSKR